MFSDSEDEEEEDRQRVHNTAGDNESDIRRSMPGGQNIKLAKAQIAEINYGGVPSMKKGPTNVLAPDLGSSMNSGTLNQIKMNVVTLGVQAAESTEDLEAARQINLNELQSLLA